jgi:hypothetical protein
MVMAQRPLPNQFGMKIWWHGFIAGMERLLVEMVAGLQRREVSFMQGCRR